MVNTTGASEVQITTAILNGSTTIQDIESVQEMFFLLSETEGFETTTKLPFPKDFGNVQRKVYNLDASQLYFYKLRVTFVGGDIEEGGVQSFQTASSSAGGLDFRPHTMIWRTKDGPSGETPEGYPLPGIPGIVIETPCRFHLGGNKEFKNEDSNIVKQVGTIRLDPSVELPEEGMSINIPDYFSGIVRGVFKGQLSSRIEV